MKFLWLLFLTVPLWGDVKQLRTELQEKFRAVEIAQSETEYAKLLEQVRSLRKQITAAEEATKASHTMGEQEPFALWDMGETTVSQLIMEYGASDYLYIIPPEISVMKISLFTSIPLPRESWDEMIEAILVQNGLGAKKINPYVKQLYILKLDPSAVEGIVDQEQKLDLFASHARLFFVLSPPPEQLRSVQNFFERFSDPKQTTVQSIGAKVVLISTKETIEKLLRLYHTIWEKTSGKTVRVLPLAKVPVAEAEKVLKAVFSDGANKGRPNFYPPGGDELIVLGLPQGLVLVGEPESTERGEKILQDLESQLEDPGEKVIYWYPCKHSNPEDIAAVLEKVYDSLIGSNFEKKAEAVAAPPPPPVPPQEPNPAQVFPYPPTNSAYNPVLPANPNFIQPGVIEKKAPSNFGRFVVDTKTTSLLMVVRREELPKIKGLLKKLDVPKRMVQLDVLLVEKRLTDRNQIGVNLLQIGTNSSGKKESAVSFDTQPLAPKRGILEFIYSKPKGSFPATDITYSFLMAQDDIRINANPSVLAINQTPATVSIVEEISINNGAIQLNTTAGVTVQESFTRAQYGITIVLTPTIHLPDLDDAENREHPGFVSLQTNLEFDTTQITADSRPPVTRRHVENEVCVADGETVILGGLRRKVEEDVREKIPFLGDIPGIGKLFSFTKATDTNTEMFIFITPRIVRDPVDSLRQIRTSEYQKRAGDIPEFLAELDAAKEKARSKVFQQSLKTLFDL